MVPGPDGKSDLMKGFDKLIVKAEKTDALDAIKEAKKEIENAKKGISSEVKAADNSVDSSTA